MTQRILLGAAWASICLRLVRVGRACPGATQLAEQGDHSAHADTTQSPGQAIRHRSLRGGAPVLHHAR